MDKDAGTLVVDRFLYTAMRYPGNYGFIPHTLSGRRRPLRRAGREHPRHRPGRRHERASGRRAVDGRRSRRRRKIIAVPSSKLTQRYDKVKNYSDLPEITLQQIQHFFEHYKDLEPRKMGESAEMGRRLWGGAGGMRSKGEVILPEGIARANAK